MLPGPLCGQILADAGAAVIKVEAPSGDPLRYIESVSGNSPLFTAINRRKKSIALDVKHPQGKKIFLALAKKADVIIAGFRPAALSAMALDYAAIKKINPRIVYCLISGYGSRGRNKNNAGHDLNFSAESGLLDVLYETPIVPGFQIADITTALYAAHAITAALYSRLVTGKGAWLDISMRGTLEYLLDFHRGYARHAKKNSPLLCGRTPCYNVYMAKDKKYVTLAAVEQKFWEHFCAATNRPDFLGKKLNTSDGFHREMQRLFVSKTARAWISLNKKYEFCLAPVQKITNVRPQKRSGTAPGKGEHSKEILTELGYSGTAISALQKNNIVGVL